MNAIGLAVLTPIAFAFALPLFAKIVGSRREYIFGYSLIATLVTLILSALVFKEAYHSSEPLVYTFGRWVAPIGILYEVDKLNATIALTTSFLMFLIAIYSYEYLKHEKGLEWYYTLYLGLEAGILGVLLTGDAFNLFVMIEVTSIAAYGLVMFYRDRGDAVVAGLKYAFIGAVGTTIYFLAVIVLYGGLGTLNMADLAAKVHGISFPVSEIYCNNIALVSGVALVLATWAFMIKAAIFPTHFWLPEAHPAAPTPISAILSGLVVNVGVYSMLRFFITIYGGITEPTLTKVVSIIGTILIVLGAFSTIFAAIMMNVQKDIKRLIAYSTIVHMGYIASAIGLGTSLGVEASLFHIVNHAIAKALMFLAAGVFIQVAGSRMIDDLSGIGKHVPIATFAFAISTFSLVGIPPLNVFYSKLLLFTAYMEFNIGLSVVMVVSSIIALVAYIRVLYKIVWGPEKEIKQISTGTMSGVCLILALIIIAVGLLAPTIYNALISPAASQAMDYNTYIEVVRKLVESFFF